MGLKESTEHLHLLEVLYGKIKQLHNLRWRVEIIAGSSALFNFLISIYIKKNFDDFDDTLFMFS